MRLISVELEIETARNILTQLEHRPMPPGDEEEEAQNELYIALIEALKVDDSEESDGN